MLCDISFFFSYSAIHIYLYFHSGETSRRAESCNYVTIVPHWFHQGYEIKNGDWSNITNNYTHLQEYSYWNPWTLTHSKVIEYFQHKTDSLDSSVWLLKKMSFWLSPLLIWEHPRDFPKTLLKGDKWIIL